MGTNCENCPVVFEKQKCLGLPWAMRYGRGRGCGAYFMTMHMKTILPPPPPRGNRRGARAYFITIDMKNYTRAETVSKRHGSATLLNSKGQQVKSIKTGSGDSLTEGQRQIPWLLLSNRMVLLIPTWLSMRTTCHSFQAVFRIRIR